MINEVEVWKDVVGFEGIYKVSNFGNVSSRKGKILKPNITNNGYCLIHLTRKCVRIAKTAHSLVAHAFLNFKHDENVDLVIDHINNIKTDNRLSNLQLVSQRINNSKDKQNKTSVFTGVCYDLNKSKWKASFFYKRRIIHLGYFDSEIEAKDAYDKALTEINQGLDLNIIYPKKELKKSFIYRNRDKIRWSSYVLYNNKKIHLGTFIEKSDAEKEINKALDIIQKGINPLLTYRQKDSNKYKGVVYDKSKRKWKSSYKGKFIGRFTTEEEAYQAVQEHIKNLQTNKIQEKWDSATASSQKRFMLTL